MHKGYFKDDVLQGERKRLTIKSRLYTHYGENLYKLRLDGILWQYLSPMKANAILIKLHDGSVEGHYHINTTIKKKLTIGYWWPTI
jgi:hypothetical protein